jgi:hypothetical protein
MTACAHCSCASRGCVGQRLRTCAAPERSTLLPSLRSVDSSQGSRSPSAAAPMPLSRLPMARAAVARTSGSGSSSAFCSSGISSGTYGVMSCGQAGPAAAAAAAAADNSSASTLNFPKHASKGPAGRCSLQATGKQHVILSQLYVCALHFDGNNNNWSQPHRTMCMHTSETPTKQNTSWRSENFEDCLKLCQQALKGHK